MNGYFTQTEIINLGLLVGKINLDTAKIQDLIDTDLASTCKKEMEEGIDYYDCQHDILDRRRYYAIDGALHQYGTNKINNRLPNPFHQALVDQKVAYITNEPVKISIEESQKDSIEIVLKPFLGDKFNEIMMSYITGASNKAFEVLHWYIDSKGQLKYVIVPAEQIIPIYDTQYQNELLYVMRYYEIEEITTNGTTSVISKRYKVEWWDKKKVEYFIQDDNDNFVHDPDYSVNPAPHWMQVFEPNDGTEAKVIGTGSWEKVPFVILWNNENETNDLRPIKPLIDAYDIVDSDFCNDIEEFNRLIYVIKGFVGNKNNIELSPGTTQLSLLIKNMIEECAIHVEEGGGVEPIRGDIPFAAREKFLDITRKAIYYFGKGVDTEDKTLGSDPSGVVLKFLYSRLDDKASRLIINLKLALKEFFWFPIEWNNRNSGTKLDASLIDTVITKSQIFNEKEKVDMLNACYDNISEETYLENLPFIPDVPKELERLKAQREERMKSENETLKKELELMKIRGNGNAVPQN